MTVQIRLNPNLKAEVLKAAEEKLGAKITPMDEITPPMRKGYLASWKLGENHVTDYWFNFTPEKAAVWETRQEAENDCTAIFSHFGIDILAVGGGTYFCRRFVVEERGPGAFVVCCVAPFRSVNSAEESAGRTP